MLNLEGKRQGRRRVLALTLSSETKEKMRYVMPLVMLLAVAGCDSTKTRPVDDGQAVRKSVGTFRALLNGRPWEAKAEYFLTPQGYVYLNTVMADPVRQPYEQHLILSDFAGCFCRETVLTVENAVLPQNHRVSFFEMQGDGVIQSWKPVPGSPGALRVTESDSTTHRFRATFEGTFVATSPPNVPIQMLPDTLRITNGVFEIPLNTSKR